MARRRRDVVGGRAAHFGSRAGGVGSGRVGGKVVRRPGSRVDGWRPVHARVACNGRVTVVHSWPNGSTGGRIELHVSAG